MRFHLGLSIVRMNYGGEWDSNKTRNHYRIYQMFCFFNGIECAFYHRVDELAILADTMKTTGCIDILDHNLLHSVDNMFEDVMIQFIF